MIFAKKRANEKEAILLKIQSHTYLLFLSDTLIVTLLFMKDD